MIRNKTQWYRLENTLEDSHTLIKILEEIKPIGVSWSIRET